MSVQAWSEKITIPTYQIGLPDKNPVFLERRVYQGSSGVVYPYPVIERVFDEKIDQLYTAIFLENRYLKIMILPELGGRVQMALDKTNGYHFIYYNRVIKPALVGLAGPWISGGIEFNWPQHHRPSTFEAVDWHIAENVDGSKTVCCGEVERMFFTKGMHSFTLRPDRAVLEIDVQLYNRSAEPQTFLWWANPAVHVNDDYQSIFPPDVHAVMDHGKRDVSEFPIAKGVYYKTNYAPGTDISRYKNIPVPTSYMAYHSDFDFVGDYDHGKQAGMMHVANHHLVPGKKQWTWGNSAFGLAWDRQLTDEDGPYIELMCGAFTDNQPDFSWLMPGEEKHFSQSFMPYKHIGGAKNANREAVINLEIDEQQATIGVYVTQPRQVRVQLSHPNGDIYNQTHALSPELAFTKTIAIPAAPAQSFTLRVLDESRDGTHELISFTPLPAEKSPIPAAAVPAPAPPDIDSNEALFLNGQHLEQYRHATFAPEPYYQEALRRDPHDSRCNNALGMLLYRRGKFAEAEAYFHRAIASLTRRNPNPYDGEAYYNLGLSLKMQGRLRPAFDAFYKATWNAAWQDAAYFELALLAARLGEWAQAHDLSTQALRRNWSHHKARHLKIAILRHLQRWPEMTKEIEIALDLDSLDFGVIWEATQLPNAKPSQQMNLGKPAQRYLELALDYVRAGLYDDAIMVLSQSATQFANEPAHLNEQTLSAYYLAYCHWQKGDDVAATAAFKHAASLPPDYCFPHRLDDILVLQAASHANPHDAHAPYYLGNFWYAHRRYDEAIACWEQSCQLDPNFATVQRNLGLAYCNKRNDLSQAKAAYERAFALNPRDARVLFELDQLDKKCNQPLDERLARLQANPTLLEQRDDLTIELVTLLNLLGRHTEAYTALMGRNFHPWEGGEGKTTAQYAACLIGQARQHLAQQNNVAALDCLNRALDQPHNLGEGKLPSAQENNIHYYLGVAYQASGDKAKAIYHYQQAAVGLSEPSSAVFYNDQPPDMIFYQGLARQALAQLGVGQAADATFIFEKLIAYGQAHLNDEVKMDYFAVSLPSFGVFDDDLTLRNRIHCHYMAGLGYIGLGQTDQANHHFDEVLRYDISHQGVLAHQNHIFL